MAALASAAEIPPGGEGEIEARINIEHQIGQISKVISVTTTDPDQPRVVLQVKAEVMIEAYLASPVIELGLVLKGEKASGRSKLVTTRPGEVKISRIEPFSDWPNTRIELVGDDEIFAEVTTKEVGLIQQRYKVFTTSTKIPELTLDVTGHVVGIWDVSPHSFTFRRSNDDPEPQAIIKVATRRETPYKVLRADDLSGAVAAKLNKIADGYRIDLVLKEIPPRQKGVIDITTDDPEEPLILVKYQVISNRGR